MKQFRDLWQKHIRSVYAGLNQASSLKITAKSWYVGQHVTIIVNSMQNNLIFPCTCTYLPYGVITGYYKFLHLMFTYV